MRKLMEMFVEEVNRRKHLSSLLKDVCITVEIKSGQELLFLVVEDETLSIVNKVDKRINVKINGDQEVLSSLLLGEIKLREAKRRNLLLVESTFRTSLFLESLFKLAMPVKNGLITEDVLTI
ncbi:hypothetical protein [Bacillus dakarensis]|uniref:hypothetical protein n=1 Tax=Robertmurraya dakarensis TaxID=1926278 RepID=UPI0009810E7B|nr:hypothetical protein [Bacillus dakarensis]